MAQQRRKFTGLIDSHQVPLIECDFCVSTGEHSWLIWINYNRERTCGTCLRLNSDGSITRETWTPTGEIVGVGTIKSKEG